ncbi:hypothetical protein CVT26_010145 [Gymnopilus dilepis]|uniref:Autophagy-related protein 4 n=1 Tax=Gymnopilus dilepis TaxID=231916 RepID=A0A409YRZ5_9AGAR|nr:hypothetical protein CVT26_010145 [Gymnopilus dilepis]
MSSKNSRHTPSPSPSSPSPGHAPSKLPKFLQKQTNRDRAKSVTDPGPSGGGGSPSTTSSSSVSASPEPSLPKPRKTSKFLSINKDKAVPPPPPPPDSSHNAGNTSVEMEEPPVIVEPVSIPRPRTRSERPANPPTAASAPDASSSSSSSHHHALPPTLYSSTSSTSRIGDLPTRLSGWFTHTFSTSTNDLSLPNLLAQNTSPKGKGPSALLTAAKHGKGHLDKAMRYLLDSDAQPDKCMDPIWLLGVQHPGYEPSAAAVVPVNTNRRSSGSPHSFRSSTSSIASADPSLSQSQGPASSKHNPAANWPPVFYLDFTSRIWLTYRSHFPHPIRDSRLNDLQLCGDNWESLTSSPTTTRRPWNWGGERTWTSDSGWGCMLRTGQSLLANALLHVHLGRDWRRPPHPIATADYATYVQILTWFLDTPAPEAPFSVHRMALAGKELGTDVGQWFGPSVAAGAIRTLVAAFPECGLAVSVATDGTLYQTQVYAASHGDSSRSPRRHHKSTWGDRPVLLLLGIRLGIEGVNPIYYESIKQLYTFPQSVGIAGGRPSSSYYFVGSQSDNLFYLDPHNARPAIPLRPPPKLSDQDKDREAVSESEAEPRKRPKSPQHRSGTPNSQQQYQHMRVPTSPSSVRTGSSNFSFHAPVSPSPLQQQLSSSSSASNTSSLSYNSEDSTNSSMRSPPPSYTQHSQHGRWRSASVGVVGSTSASTSTMRAEDLSRSSDVNSNADTSFSSSNRDSYSNRDSQVLGQDLDPIQMHYCTAYSAAELKTFHCDRVRKMPLSGLDPSMLIGFLCRDEADWLDFRRRVGELPRPIFAVQDEPPTWPSDSDDNMGLESISEPDDLDLDDEGDGEGDGVEVDADGEDDHAEAGVAVGDVLLDTVEGDEDDDADGDGEQFFDTREIDTEDSEDPADPLTPGPNSKFDFVEHPRPAHPSKRREHGGHSFPPEEEEEGFRVDDDDDGEDSREGNDDIEDDWIDPSLPTPTGPPAASYRPSPAPPPPLPQSSHAQSHPRQVPRGSTTKEHTKDVSSSSSASSSSAFPPPPPLKTKSSSSSTSTKPGSGSKSKKGKKQIPVPVPTVRIPSQHAHHGQEHQEQYYPFPVTPADYEPSSQGGAGHDRSRNPSTKGQGQTKIPRMHTARARDGGRTQSGGVKGILPD